MDLLVCSELNDLLRGVLVTADHPITVLNPDPVFSIHEVKVDCERKRIYVRGEKTMWFDVALVKKQVF